MAEYGRAGGLPEIAWTIRSWAPFELSAQVSDVMHADPGAVGAAWAEFLGLEVAEPPVCPGTLEWRGDVPSLHTSATMPVEVWAIIDRDVMEAAR